MSNDTLERRAQLLDELRPHQLREYLDSVRSLPRPTSRQISAFAAYVVEVHSWYKHLPLLHPGARFSFFLDPSAGCEWHWSESGELQIVDRTADSVRFHHSFMTTADYRDSFGHLAYFADRAPRFFLASAAGMAESAETAVVIVDGKSGWIPAEVTMRFSSLLTAMVHPRAPMPQIWQRKLEQEVNAGGYWHDASGGKSVLKKLRKLVRQDKLFSADLLSITQSERERQQQEVQDQLNALVTYCYQPSDSFS